MPRNYRLGKWYVTQAERHRENGDLYTLTRIYYGGKPCISGHGKITFEDAVDKVNHFVKTGHRPDFSKSLDEQLELL